MSVDESGPTTYNLQKGTLAVHGSSHWIELR